AKLQVQWQKALLQNWPSIHFGKLQVETRENQHHFFVQVNLAALDPTAVQVELYQEDNSQKMSLLRKVPNEQSLYEYGLAVSAARPQSDYTPRIVPFFSTLSIPLESSFILWQK